MINNINMNKNLQQLKQYLFDKDIYFELNVDTNFAQINFYKFDTDFTIYFKYDSNMIRMLIYSETYLKSHYSNEIDEIIEQIDIFLQ